MPDLPTLTVTDTQADRLINAFDGQTDDDGNALTAVQAYKRWLTVQLREYVKRSEAQTLREQHNATLRDTLAKLDEELP